MFRKEVQKQRISVTVLTFYNVCTIVNNNRNVYLQWIVLFDHLTSVHYARIRTRLNVTL